MMLKHTVLVLSLLLTLELLVSCSCQKFWNPGKDECFDAKKATRFKLSTGTFENHDGSTRASKGRKK